MWPVGTKVRLPPGGKCAQSSSTVCRATEAYCGMSSLISLCDQRRRENMSLYSVIMSMTPVQWSSFLGSRNGRKKLSRPGASRSQSTASTFFPEAARIQAVLASAMVRPVPPL